jgi:opacity protein-like surface antigen
MKRIVGYGLVVMTFCMAVMSAEAARPYVRGNVSMPLYRNFKMSGKSYTPSPRPAGGGSIGLTFNPYFAAEVEGSFMNLPVSFSAVPTSNLATITEVTKSRAALRAATVFANALFYPLGKHQSKLKPFIGVGVGVVRTNVGGSSATVRLGKYVFSNPDTGEPDVVDEHPVQNTSKGKVNHKVGYHAILGVEYVFSEYLSVLSDIRWIHLGKFKQNYTATTPGEYTKYIYINNELTGKIQAAWISFGLKCTW